MNKSNRFEDSTGRDMRLLIADPCSLTDRERRLIGAPVCKHGSGDFDIDIDVS